MSREILDCLKRERDICVKNVIHSQNTAFMFTPALRELWMLCVNLLHIRWINNLCVRQVPQSYTDLQQAVIQEAERRRSTGEPPILLEDEILRLAKSSPQNDILNTEELTLGKLVWLSLRVAASSMLLIATHVLMASRWRDSNLVPLGPRKRGWPANFRRFVLCLHGKFVV